MMAKHLTKTLDHIAECVCVRACQCVLLIQKKYYIYKISIDE